MQADDDRKALVRRFFDEVWNQGRFEFMDEFYAPDFKLHALWENTALGGSGDADIDGAKAAIRGWRAGFPDLKVTVEEQVVEGEMVTSRHFAIGTNDRSFRGIPPTGKVGSMSRHDDDADRRRQDHRGVDAVGHRRADAATRRRARPDDRRAQQGARAALLPGALERGHSWRSPTSSSTRTSSATRPATRRTHAAPRA